MERLKNWTIRKIGWTDLFEVIDSFYWLIDYEDKDGWMIIAEEGFRTNYGSIPAIFRIFFDPTRYNSYVLHDKMYWTQMKYHKWRKEFQILTRKEADKILLEWIEYEGAWFIEKFCIYFGVRLGGWINWYL